MNHHQGHHRQCQIAPASGSARAATSATRLERGERWQVSVRPRGETAHIDDVVCSSSVTITTRPVAHRLAQISLELGKVRPAEQHVAARASCPAQHQAHPRSAEHLSDTADVRDQQARNGRGHGIDFQVDWLSQLAQPLGAPAVGPAFRRAPGRAGAAARCRARSSCPRSGRRSRRWRWDSASLAIRGKQRFENVASIARSDRARQACGTRRRLTAALAKPAQGVSLEDRLGVGRSRSARRCARGRCAGTCPRVRNTQVSRFCIVRSRRAISRRAGVGDDGAHRRHVAVRRRTGHRRSGRGRARCRARCNQPSTAGLPCGGAGVEPDAPGVEDANLGIVEAHERLDVSRQDRRLVRVEDAIDGFLQVNSSSDGTRRGHREGSAPDSTNAATQTATSMPAMDQMNHRMVTR